MNQALVWVAMQSRSKATKLTIKNFDLFDSVTEEELQKLIEASEVQDCETSEVLVAQGDLLPDVYFILSGGLNGKRVSELDPTTETVLHFYEPGDVAGHEMLFNNVPYPISLIASADTTVMSIRRETLAEIAQNNSKLMMALLKRIAAQLNTLESNFYMLLDSDFNIKH